MDNPELRSPCPLLTAQTNSSCAKPASPGAPPWRTPRCRRTSWRMTTPSGPRPWGLDLSGNISSRSSWRGKLVSTGSKCTESRQTIRGGHCFCLVSKKKQGLVFRGHFRPLNGRKSKKGRKQTPPKIQFYLLGGVFNPVYNTYTPCMLWMMMGTSTPLLFPPDWTKKMLTISKLVNNENSWEIFSYYNS